MEGFIQIKRHEIHHDALESRFRRSSPTEENPRLGGRYRERGRSVYLNDCFAQAVPDQLGRSRLASPLGTSTSGEFNLEKCGGTFNTSLYRNVGRRSYTIPDASSWDAD